MITILFSKSIGAEQMEKAERAKKKERKKERDLLRLHLISRFLNY